MTTQDFHSSFGLHTKVKLDLYEKYLELYLIVLSRVTTVKQINVYDFFCGKGKTDQGEDGSALRAFKVINKTAAIQRNNIIYKLLCFDKCGDYCENLVELINFMKRPANVHFSVECKEFKDSLMMLCENNLKQVNNGSIKSILFIDPYGYKETMPDRLQQIKRLQHAEFILFVPITSMYRFINGKEINPSLRDWVDFIGNPQQVESEGDLIQKVTMAFENIGFYSGSFLLRNQKSNNCYALFFGTSNVYGLEKFNEVKWQLDECEGMGMKFEHDSLILPSIEDHLLNTKMDKLKETVISYVKGLSSKKASNVDLYEYLIIQGYLPKHFNKMLKESAFLGVEYEGDNYRKGATYLSYEYYPKKNIRAWFSIK